VRREYIVSISSTAVVSINKLHISDTRLLREALFRLFSLTAYFPKAWETFTRSDFDAMPPRTFEVLEKTMWMGIISGFRNHLGSEGMDAMYNRLLDCLNTQTSPEDVVYEMSAIFNLEKAFTWSIISRAFSEYCNEMDDADVRDRFSGFSQTIGLPSAWIDGEYLCEMEFIFDSQGVEHYNGWTCYDIASRQDHNLPQIVVR
jgi:glutaredoxin-related protein